MHLISLILEKPGIGSLQADKSTMQEITSTMAASRGYIYASESAIEQDLQWLEDNGIIASNNKFKPIQEEISFY
ncbi:hypothetical protein NIES4071_03690 [Calothrix sp. NIES-4071]|nr:hypothetical protein NIES4071_03690 [Calothrix sp. NIES-4071]BAZ54715.1 hypothetical protein NIES4105_03680 [Calothrix sp. NIES-4105]